MKLNSWKQEILCVDLGVSVIKAIFCRRDWNNKLEPVFFTTLPVDDIYTTSLDFLKLTEAITTLIYKIEGTISVTIRNLAICFSFYPISLVEKKTQLDINGIVENSHLESLSKENKNIGDDKVIISTINKYFSAPQKIDNPTGMRLQKLQINETFLVADKIFIDNLLLALERARINTTHVEYAPALWDAHIRGDYLSLDFGFYNTRCLLKTKHQISHHFIDYGFFNFLSKHPKEDVISAGLVISPGSPWEIVKENKYYLKNFIRRILDFFHQETLMADIPLFIGGSLCFLNPLSYFLHTSFDRSFFLMHETFNMEKGYENAFALMQQIEKETPDKIPFIYEKIENLFFKK